MAENQELANDIGATLRSAEAAAGAGNLGQVIADLGTLHGQLGQAFHAYNRTAEVADRALLEWDPVAGNSASRAGGAVANSGGTPKGPPPQE